MQHLVGKTTSSKRTLRTFELTPDIEAYTNQGLLRPSANAAATTAAAGAAAAAAAAVRIGVTNSMEKRDVAGHLQPLPEAAGEDLRL